MTHMNIGEAAAAVGVTPKMIRHYAALGKISGVQRTDASYRLYAPREVAMLRFTQQARVRYEASAADLLELLDAQRSAHDGQAALAAALMKQRQRLVAVFKGIGFMVAAL